MDEQLNEKEAISGIKEMFAKLFDATKTSADRKTRRGWPSIPTRCKIPNKTFTAKTAIRAKVVIFKNMKPRPESSRKKDKKNIDAPIAAAIDKT